MATASPLGGAARCSGHNQSDSPRSTPTSRSFTADKEARGSLPRCFATLRKQASGRKRRPDGLTRRDPTPMATIEPFSIAVEPAVLADLRSRLVNTRWGGDFGGDDWTLGVNGVYLRELVCDWIERYDWPARQRVMNTLPQFRTTVGGAAIHFVHVRGQGPRPTPLLLTHGWPWTFWDFQKV